MKVLKWCMGRMPNEIIPFVTDDVSWRWGEVISYIESKADHDTPLFDKNAPTPGTIIRKPIFKDADRYVYHCYTSGAIFEIVDVDTSRPWCIRYEDDSDGEYIQYLDYKVIKPSVNYCDFIENSSGGTL